MLVFAISTILAAHSGVPSITNAIFAVSCDNFSLPTTLFKYSGPACVYGKCPEGTMSCGNSAEMKKLYASEVK